MIENFTAQTKPLWIATAPGRHRGQLDRDLRDIDVVIVGGGITGITAALQLKLAGKKVVVIEMGRIGHGETGHTTAHLTEVLDLDFKDLIGKFGVEKAQLATQSSRRAIQMIENNVRAYGILCGFKRVPGYKYAETSVDRDYLESESEFAQRAAVQNTIIPSAPLPFATAGAIRFDYQAQFNPSIYLNHLADKVAGDGSFIFEDTRVSDVNEGEPCEVHTDHGTIFCKDVIVAANVPVLNRLLLHTKIAPYRTYALAVTLKNQTLFDGLFWDTADPYHYIRSYSDGALNYLIVGGQDHKTGQEDHTNISFQKLEDYTREHFDVETIAYRWSGQVIESVDGLPFIGRNSLSEHIYVATGNSGNGMTFGTVAGILLSDLIIGEDNPWAELYDATRFKPLASVGNFISENIDFPSRLIGDRVSAVADSDLNHVREDEGRIVRMGAKKVAAYRDPEGELHLLSPVCPHLGCYVNWNQAEKSWDCPCHGSRFSPLGQVLNGPAVSDLASEQYDENAQMRPERYDNGVEGIEALNGPIVNVFSCPFKPQGT